MSLTLFHGRRIREVNQPCPGSHTCLGTAGVWTWIQTHLTHKTVPFPLNLSSQEPETGLRPKTALTFAFDAATFCLALQCFSGKWWRNRFTLVISLPNKLEFPEENENPVKGPEFKEPITELSIFLPKLNEALVAPSDGSLLFSDTACLLFRHPPFCWHETKMSDSSCNFVEPNRRGRAVLQLIFCWLHFQNYCCPAVPCCCSMLAKYFS